MPSLANEHFLLLAFILGAGSCGGILLFAQRNRLSLLSQTAASSSQRAAELESLLACRSEEYTQQATAKSMEHLTELERLSNERLLEEDRHRSELRTKVREAEDLAYEEGKRQAELRADEKGKAFSVIVRPYIRKVRDDGFLKKANRLEVGYLYQLQINGIPCFDPHVVIEQHYEERVVNQEVIERMTRLALEAAKTAVAIQAGPAGAFIPIASSPVIEG